MGNTFEFAGLVADRYPKLHNARFMLSVMLSFGLPYSTYLVLRQSTGKSITPLSIHHEDAVGLNTGIFQGIRSRVLKMEKVWLK
jgi:hypothetical protein